MHPICVIVNAGSCSIDLCNVSKNKDKARRHWKVSNARTTLHMSPLPCHSLIFQLESHALCIFLPDQNALLALNTRLDAICSQEVFLCLTHIIDFIEPLLSYMGLFQFESGNGPLPLPAAGLKEKRSLISCHI